MIIRSSSIDVSEEKCQFKKKINNRIESEEQIYEELNGKLLCTNGSWSIQGSCPWWDLALSSEGESISTQYIAWNVPELDGWGFRDKRGKKSKCHVYSQESDKENAWKFRLVPLTSPGTDTTLRRRCGSKWTNTCNGETASMKDSMGLDEGSLVKSLLDFYDRVSTGLNKRNKWVDSVFLHVYCPKILNTKS